MARVVCSQLAPVIGDLAANCDAAVGAVRAAVAAGADLALLPELATSGYVFESAAEAASVAITPGHALFERCARELPGAAAAVFGFCEDGGDGRVYNSAALVTAEGVRAVYRKTHLWDAEKLYFTPGSQPPPVVATPGGAIGMLICYDLEFPEMTRSLALGGADLIAVPTNWPLVPRPAGERAPEVVIAMAAARTNRVFIACCDRTGTERGQLWTAGTSIIDHEGWVLATAGADQTAAADLALHLARDKGISARNDVLADRRPELYAPVVRAP